MPLTPLPENSLSEADRMATISRIGMQITATLDLEKTFDRLYTHINQLMDAHTFGIGIIDRDSEQIDFALAVEGGHRYKPYTRDLKDKNQLAVWCIDHGQTLVLNAFEEVARYITYQEDIEERRAFEDTDDRAQRIESYLYVPIWLMDEVIGILSVQSFRPGAYEPIHVDMIQALSSYTAIAIDNARAYSQLAEALEQLKETQKQLIVQETLASLGTLTAGVAHEINNPTNFLHVAAQNLEVDLAEFVEFLIHLAGDNAAPEIIASIRDRTDGLSGHVRIIHEGASRIARIVSDLRAFARPHEEARPHPMQVGRGLESTVNLVKTNYLDLVSFELEIGADPEIQGHAGQLNQVFMNLLVNACQAIVAADKPGAGRVRISTEQDGDQLVIRFRDDGTGMSDEIAARVFEPFFSTKAPGQGTGMGLSISHGIVEQHGGCLEVESVLGDGSEFRVLLPLLAPTED